MKRENKIKSTVNDLDTVVRMIFGLSLYIVSLLVTLVAYFGMELGNLVSEKTPEDSKVCYYQH